jgi:hypothetical protein
MIEKKIDGLLGEAWVNRASKTHSRTKDVDFIKPPDTGFRRGRSLEHEFGSHGIDSTADVEAPEVKFVIQQNLRCCWTCNFITGSGLTSLKCKNKENTGRAFESVEPTGLCGRYRNSGVYK